MRNGFCTAVVVTAGVVGAAGCARSDGDVTIAMASPEARLARTVCEALRSRYNTFGGIANDAASTVNDLSPVERHQAILSGYDTALDAARDYEQRVTVLMLPEVDETARLRDELHEGATEGIDELLDSRAEFADGPHEFSDGDIAGQVFTFFNAIEKTDAVAEPDIVEYQRDAFREAFVDEPSCKNVIQPF